MVTLVPLPPALRVGGAEAAKPAAPRGAGSAASSGVIRRYPF